MLGFDQDLTGNLVKARNQSDKPCNICVKGLPPDMTQQDLESHFAEKYGSCANPIRSVKIAKDIMTGKSRGYGFVCF